MGLKASYLTPGFDAQPAVNGEGWTITKLHRLQGLDTGSETLKSVDAQWIGKTITKACARNEPERCVALKSQWLIDTPMLISTTSGQWAFVKEQQSLFALGSQLIVHSIDGNQAAIELRPLASAHIDERIATQLIAALLIYTMGCAMLAYVQRTPEVWLAFVMCAGYSIFVLMRVWYTNRTWAQPEWHWYLAMAGFKLGVLMCACGCLMVIWRLRLKNRFSTLLYALLGVVVVTVVLQSAGVIDSVFLGYRLPTFFCLIAIVASSIYAAFDSSKHGQEKAARSLQTKTFVQLITMGFLPALATNAIWAFRPDVTQIAFLNNFAIASAGIPVVILVTRSSEYRLQKFWWTLWLVLIVCTIGIVGAGVLALVSGLSASLALILAFAASSWIVYLMRIWLAKKLLGTSISIQKTLPKLMALPVGSPEDASQQWQRILVEAYEPHSVKKLILARIDGQAKVEIREQGEILVVPDLLPQSAIELHGAMNFTRSFNEQDVEAVSTLVALAMQGLEARDSYTAGVVRERQRIAADLHDDIGGKLLHLASASGAEGQYARDTLDDLRTITRGLNAEPRSLNDMLADLQYQLAQRADRNGIELSWAASLGPFGEQTLSSRQSTVLASIGSELLRNAMQHKSAKAIQFDLRIVKDLMLWQVANDGDLTDPNLWKHGLGTTSIRRRINDLQGYCAWAAKPGGGVIFSAQWPAEAMFH